jgi:hypothetical protein
MIRSVVLAIGVLLAGCEGGGAAFGPDDERFVETIVALRRAALDAGADTAAFEAARARILEERGVTEASLESYVERRSADLREMAAIWDSVNARLSQERER